MVVVCIIASAVVIVVAVVAGVVGSVSNSDWGVVDCWVVTSVVC